MEKRIEISSETNAKLNTTATKLEVKSAELMTKIMTAAALIPADQIVRWLEEGAVSSSPAQLLEHTAGVLEGLEADGRTHAMNQTTALHLRKMAVLNADNGVAMSARRPRRTEKRELPTLADVPTEIPETLKGNSSPYVRADLIRKQRERWGLTHEAAKRVRDRIRSRDCHVEVERFMLFLPYCGKPTCYVRADALKMLGSGRKTGGGSFSPLAAALHDLVTDDTEALQAAYAIPGSITANGLVYSFVRNPVSSVRLWLERNPTARSVGFVTELCLRGTKKWPRKLVWLEERTHADYLKTRELVGEDNFRWSGWLAQRT
jgi:hypothetical protein